jgi:hypothetical protein
MVEGWGQLHNEEELHNVFHLPSIIRMVQSRSMRSRHVARKNVYFDGKARKKEITLKT